MASIMHVHIVRARTRARVCRSVKEKGKGSNTPRKLKRRHAMA